MSIVKNKTETNEERILRLEEEIRKVRDQLRLWAIESKTGGWSTQLVEPMRKQADRLDELLYFK